MKKKKLIYFEFDQIDFNLADYSSNSIMVPKIQERSSPDLINCVLIFLKKRIPQEEESVSCNKTSKNEINQELIKRFYKPIYIPIIGLLCCFLIIVPKK